MSLRIPLAVCVAATVLFTATGQDVSDSDRPVAEEGRAGVRDPEQILSLPSGNRFTVDVGEEFAVWFSLPRTRSDEVGLTLPELPEGVRTVAGPTIISRGFRDIEVRIDFVAAVAGRFVIEEIAVTTPEGARYSRPILVEVYDPRLETIPFQARWRVLSESVFQAQSVPVVLEIAGIDSFAYPETLAFRAPQTGLFEEVGGLGTVSTRTVAGVTLYQFPVASFVFTPAASGAVTIPAAEVTSAGVRSVAPAATLQVAALPREARTTAAVGAFAFSAEVDPQRLTAGETGTIRLVVEGQGNLPVLDFPAVTLGGLTELGQSERSDVEPDLADLRGYRGRREVEIRFEAQTGAGDATVAVADFAFFDPTTGESAVVTTPSFLLDVTDPGEAVEVTQTAPATTLIPIDQLTWLRWYPFARNPWLYLLFFGGPAGFAVARLLSVRRATVVALLPLLLSAVSSPVLNIERLNRAAQLAEEGRPEVAGVLYDLEIQNAGWHAGLHFNRGVLAVRADNAVAAMFHLRRAVRLAPHRGPFRQALADAERYFAVAEQPAIPWYPRPDWFFVATLSLWSGFWVLLSLRGRVRRTLALVSVAMVAVALAGGWLWASRQISVPEGVVTRDAIVRRIPDYTARPWINLSPATAITVELSYDDFYLARTAAGVTGWVPHTAIRIDGAR
ncbi:MAG: hypothetical protein MI724_10640 [Spirochaetales bacterium]|nr:hypothetical protein [Spirochaetales bacterium]